MLSWNCFLKAAEEGLTPAEEAGVTNSDVEFGKVHPAT
jgi:hypothetical protein